MVEERDGDVVQQQRGDGLVDAAQVFQRAGGGNPKPPARVRRPASEAFRSMAMRAERRRREHSTQSANHGAPSPPMTSRPTRAGITVHSAVSSNGAGLGQRVLDREADAECADIQSW